MTENRSTYTPLRTAIRRAEHQLLDHPKVFDDPLALRILGKEHASTLQAELLQSAASALAPLFRATLAVRSRYAEDKLALGVQHGVRQYVILGSGLDTFAYRNPYPEGVLHIFEVDHPVTQAWKRECLREAGINLPNDLTFVPVDFETQTLMQELADAGFDPNKRTFFSWLGVTPYLTTDAVMATLSLVASLPLGSEIVFDYLILPSMLSSKQRSIFDELSQRVSSAGEPWQGFFEPESLKRNLQAMGFGNVKDKGAEEINAKYFKNRQDGLRVWGLTNLMRARV